MTTPTTPHPTPARTGADRSPAFFSAAATAILAALLALPPSPATAAEGPQPSAGTVTVGYRAVDARGRAAKYREDIDLGDGFRLFGLSLRWSPAPGRRALADLVQLDASHLGGDPDEALHLRVRKVGAFDLRVDRTRSATFYRDQLIAPERADPALYTGGDPHTFDFDRVREVARLDVDVAPRARAHLGFERSTRSGASATTLSLQGDLFHLERPIDDALHAYRGGFEYTWDKVTLAIEEEVRESSNSAASFLPGPTTGEDPDDGAALDSYRLDQPVETRSRRHSVRLVARPHPRFTARLAGTIHALDARFTAAESERGTAADGRPIDADAAGDGAISRDVDLVDLDLSYRIGDRVSLIGGVSRKSLHQDGSGYVSGGYYLDPYTSGRWRIETLGGEVGLRVEVSPRLTAGGGLRGGRREVAWSTSQRPYAAPVTTRHTGFFADLGWRPAAALRLTASLETDAYDDPFSLAAPGRRTRARFRVRHRLAGAFSLSAHLSRDRSRNRESSWAATSQQAGIQLAYERPGLTASLGYAAISLDRTFVPSGGAATTALSDRADAGFLDGRIAYTFAQRWTLGGTLRHYDNRGTFAVMRGDASGFVEVALERNVSVRVGYRVLDYDEAGADFDDYRADVAELTVGWRW